MPTIGEIVSKLRELQGMTRDELAAKTGLSKGYIADLEHDRYEDISTSTVRKLKEALPTLTCDEILGADPPSMKKPAKSRGRPRKNS